MVVNGNRPTGIIAVNNQSKQYAVVFRGSKDLPDYATDFLLTLVPMQFGKNDSTANFTLMLQNKDLPKMAGRLARRQLEKPKNVHQGFLDAWNRGREKYLTILNDAISKNPSFEIVFTGHSLGGALATLAAVDFVSTSTDPMATAKKTSLITYGQPRVGDKGFAEYVDSLPWKESTRVVRKSDPIPRSPPTMFGFAHFKTEKFLVDNNNFVASCKLSGVAGETTDCSGAEVEEIRPMHTQVYFSTNMSSLFTQEC